MSAVETAQTLLAQWATETATPDPKRLDVSLSTDNLIAAVTALRESRWGYLAAITGLDKGKDKGQIEVLYQFCSGPTVLTLRVLVPRDAAVVPSVCGVIPSASFLERELMEMFGVQAEGTPDTSRLFLPDNWPAGVYPLRKDFVVAETPADATP